MKVIFLILASVLLTSCGTMLIIDKYEKVLDVKDSLMVYDDLEGLSESSIEGQWTYLRASDATLRRVCSDLSKREYFILEKSTIRRFGVANNRDFSIIGVDSDLMIVPTEAPPLLKVVSDTSILAVAISSEKNIACIISISGDVKIHDLGTNEMLYHSRIRQAYQAAFVNERLFILTSTGKLTEELWKSEEVSSHVLLEETGSFGSELDATANRLLVSRSDGVWLYAFKGMETKFRKQVTTEEAFFISYLPDNKSFLVVNRNGREDVYSNSGDKIYTLSKGEEQQTLFDPKLRAKVLCWKEDSFEVKAGGWNASGFLFDSDQINHLGYLRVGNSLKVIDLSNFQLIDSISLHSDVFLRVETVQKMESSYYYSDSKGNVFVWDSIRQNGRAIVYPGWPQSLSTRITENEIVILFGHLFGKHRITFSAIDLSKVKDVRDIVFEDEVHGLEVVRGDLFIVLCSHKALLYDKDSLLDSVMFPDSLVSHHFVSNNSYLCQLSSGEVSKIIINGSNIEMMAEARLPQDYRAEKLMFIENDTYYWMSNNSGSIVAYSSKLGELRYQIPTAHSPQEMRIIDGRIIISSLGDYIGRERRSVGGICRYTDLKFMTGSLKLIGISFDNELLLRRLSRARLPRH
jgi:hypothetical protein